MSAFEDSPVPLGHDQYWSTAEVAKRRLDRQNNWALQTISHYESVEQCYQKYPETRPVNWPSATRRKQYEAACRIKMEQILTR